jgi:hypothetical protein
VTDFLFAEFEFETICATTMACTLKTPPIEFYGLMACERTFRSISRLAMFFAIVIAAEALGCSNKPRMEGNAAPPVSGAILGAPLSVWPTSTPTPSPTQ